MRVKTFGAKQAGGVAPVPDNIPIFNTDQLTNIVGEGESANSLSDVLALINAKLSGAGAGSLTAADITADNPANWLNGNDAQALFDSTDQQFTYFGDRFDSGLASDGDTLIYDGAQEKYLPGAPDAGGGGGGWKGRNVREYTGGDFSISSATWHNVASGSVYVDVPAAIGDLILVSLEFWPSTGDGWFASDISIMDANNNGIIRRIDNRVSGFGALYNSSSFAQGDWRAGKFIQVGYIVQTGDIYSNGKVYFAMAASLKAGSSRSIGANTSQSTRMEAINLGQQAA